jgi:exonuclease VII large subunit
MDLDKLETLWKEIRTSESLIEQQLQQLSELKNSLNKLNSNIEHNSTNYFELLNNLDKNLNSTVSLKLNEYSKKLEKEAERFHSTQYKVILRELRQSTNNNNTISKDEIEEIIEDKLYQNSLSYIKLLLAVTIASAITTFILTKLF